MIEIESRVSMKVFVERRHRCKRAGVEKMDILIEGEKIAGHGQV